MALSQDARAVVFLGDYIAADPSGKLNGLGLGFQIVGLLPDGTCPPFHVAAIIDLPSKYAGEQFAVSLELRDLTTGSTVSIPQPDGRREALRIQSLALANRPAVQNVYLPPVVECRVQMAIGFQNGLPLEAGHAFQWRLEVDGNHRKDWVASFYVAAASPAPVFGGPSAPTGPADLPDIEPRAEG